MSVGTVKPYSRKQIETMTDDELYRNLNFLRRKIRERQYKKQETYEHEIEFCYLMNEANKRDRWKSEGGARRKRVVELSTKSNAASN